ncbi:MAG: LPXTG cell wall anchor domain-containing protein [Thermoanaerobaculia bacterium]
MQRSLRRTKAADFTRGNDMSTLLIIILIVLLLGGGGFWYRGRRR